MPLSLPELRRFAETSPALRLIRGDYYILDLTFLIHAFRGPGIVVIAESELATVLSRWLDTHFGDDPDQHPCWRPADRIAHYVKQAFLRKRELSHQDEPVYELTSDIDRLLLWIEDQRSREFVGTEYGLQAIIRDLRELAARSSGDRRERLAILLQRRREVDDEIDRLSKPEEDSEPDSRYILETLQRLERASQDLVGDFALLRERFSDLARDIARQHGGASVRRGDVLRLALDGEDALRRTPMGESFYGFWRLVASSERDEFVEMVDRIYTTPGLPPALSERRLLQSLLDRLRDQGQVVLDANRQLTRQLRRALDREDVETRRLMASRMNELRLLLLAHPGEFEGLEGMSVDERVDIALPLERPLFEPPEPLVVDIALRDSIPADLRAAAEQIAEAGLIDFRRLLQTIRAALDSPRYSSGVMLSKLVEDVPPAEGLLDLLGYLHLAKLLGNDAEVLDRAPFRWESERGREVVCPDVLFVSVQKLSS